jgi:predicted tellurium resistance membrane protein TerC
MEPKKLIIQVVAAILLYVGISLILEKDFNAEILKREIVEGFVFGFFYGLFIWLSSKWRKKKNSGNDENLPLN